jgi:hypothetical protein
MKLAREKLGFGVQPARKPAPHPRSRSFRFTTTITTLCQTCIEQEEHDEVDIRQWKEQKALPPNGVEPVTSALLVPRSTN